MIPFDFEYYRPNCIEEAIRLFHQLDKEGKKPIYYGGGTEIITMGRLQQIIAKAVIDLKDIPECNICVWNDQNLILGATLTLTQVQEKKVFPLLGETAGRAADHTARNKITLGGNIAGKIIYREAVLPFLLADSTFVIAGKEGVKYIKAQQAFIEKLQLQKGEFLIQIITDQKYIESPYYSVKKRQLEKIDYPLVTVAALKSDEDIRIAFSGLCAFPFRSLAIEAVLNDWDIPVRKRIERALLHIPALILDDIRGSRAYRMFVLQHVLYDVLMKLEGVK
ncbi:FAD binding domain-containing protein [Bacillus pseudomycoides]|uniref:FAD binding domain-containing protein n=1 Tax=Bacillus pseudomycoides TaxID=64104 RepID=UPI000BEDE64E|nr:FAD binding domain-containing protein [Bacillus pseudomycoides]PEB43556.1 xanthine dehydrogenase [Bacillus pseudomycoides]PGD83267.1 xanthine dehydrogenase [Bacillus pseudomycoides]PGE01283.1 xanthine dehydrogenase [Bacillus pseudomycoides]PHE72010.1 xanthine dehydrogenase [Bacillus pseudomycoides]PHG21002.1 xanthine dehydrogenase [Bacillus pseudomycoides]